MSATRLRSRLTWQAGRGVGAAQAEPVGFDLPAAAHERAIQLLHVGAEVEHALMVQYLYAGYSLDAHQPTPERRALVAEWRTTVLQIAREEMGHLATVQNLLTLIGGPLCFEREDYPIVDAGLWPFPLRLEPLTKDSLAKYVLAEMPSDAVLAELGLTAEIDAIRERVHADDEVVHRVGILYGELIKLFTEGPMVQGPHVPGTTVPYPYVATVDIQADSLPYQVTANAWGLGQRDILVDTATDRPSALTALTRLSEQGEGLINIDDTKRVPAKVHASHFYRFLEIYRKFPEPSEWSPARPVAVDPTTNHHLARDPDRAIRGEAHAWATLANLRYRMLLAYLAHSFYIEAPSAHPTRSPRGALVSWTFGEMYQIRALSEILMAMPLAPGSPLMAGPPFEMPYTLSMPPRAVDRWRVHRDLLCASLAHVDAMCAAGESPHIRYLRALHAADTTALDQIQVLIGV